MYDKKENEFFREKRKSFEDMAGFIFFSFASFYIFSGNIPSFFPILFDPLNKMSTFFRKFLKVFV